MDAPKTIDEIFERKERARRRFDDIPLLEKMQMALDLYRQLQIIRSALPEGGFSDAGAAPPVKGAKTFGEGG